MGASLSTTVPEPAIQSVPAKARPDRLDSIDMLRGVVMVIMALDHVRDFWSDRFFREDPTDLTKTTAAIFLTRWITHYCAPTFIFLAGTGAFLSGTRGKSKPELSWFLFTRGLWLAFFEVVINRILWMFSFDFYHHGAGVFWAIGLSMIGLSLLIYLPTSLVTAFGIAMVAFHNMLDGFTAQMIHLPGWLWMILHSPGDERLIGPFTFGERVIGPFTFGTGYCVIPWMGVMAAGYGLGTILLQDRAARRRQLAELGVALILAFVVVRASNVYGDPRPWSREPSLVFTVLSFLNCTKYPPSLLYLLMTLGPAILLLAIFDRPLGAWAKPIITFGRVPLFFYLLHIPLIHGGAVLCDYIRFGWSPMATDGPWAVKPDQVPANYGVSLPMVYLVWIAVVLILYPPCRWFAGVKRRRRDAWLSYF
jgi:uncharacterized membrane protein